MNSEGLRAEDLEVHQLIDILSKTKMAPRDKGEVTMCRDMLRKHGGISTPRVMRMRSLYDKYRKRIRADEAARDRARRSMAIERSRLTRAEIEGRISSRMYAMSRKVNDFGI